MIEKELMELILDSHFYLSMKKRDMLLKLSIKKIAADEFGIYELKAITTEDNIQSQKLLEKIGLKFSERIKLLNESETFIDY